MDYAGSQNSINIAKKDKQEYVTSIKEKWNKRSDHQKRCNYYNYHRIYKNEDHNDECKMIMYIRLSGYYDKIVIGDRVITVYILNGNETVITKWSLLNYFHRCAN